MSATADFSPSTNAAARLDRMPSTPWLWGILCLLFLSWFIESYDIGLTGSVLPSLTHQYHLGTQMKSLTAVSANIGIVLGIVPAGLLADRVGRRRLLIVATFIYAVLTFVTGFSSDIWMIIGLRIVAGTAMGAVFPIPYVYGSELCPPGYRGRFTGIADAFLSIGYFISPLLATWMIPNDANTTGWRIMFMLGGIPVLFAVLAWKYVPESPRWSERKGRHREAEDVLAEMERRAELHTGEPLASPATASVAPGPQIAAVPPGAEAARAAADTSTWRIFRPPLLRRSVMLWITFGGTFFIFYSIQTFMPTVVSKMGFNLTTSFEFTALIVGVSLPGKLVEAWVVERWGRKPVIVGFTVIAGVASLIFGFVHGGLLIVLIGCVMSFFGIGVDPAVKAYTAESYPTEIRAWGTSWTEGFGRLFSGIIGPYLIPVVLAHLGVEAVYTLVGAVALAAVTYTWFVGTESKGTSLEEFSG